MRFCCVQVREVTQSSKKKRKIIIIIGLANYQFLLDCDK
jgi:hypothetical protein